MANEKKEPCAECKHIHYKNFASCPSCPCGESDKQYVGDWRGHDPIAMYEGFGANANPYERTARELNLFND